MTIQEHEARVQLFLGVARRKVERARSIKATREQKRFSAILFSFSVIVGVSNILVIYVNLTRNLAVSPGLAVLMEIPIIVATVAFVAYFFQDVFQRTLKL